MQRRRLRVAVDANILIAGIQLPRWRHEVLRSALSGAYDLVLPEQVVTEARRHLPLSEELAALEAFLITSRHEELSMPARDEVSGNLDLVRSEKDVPIALALIAGDVDIFVTGDRDFTDPGATAERFSTAVRTMLPAVFLRNVAGWSSEELEAIRYRRWEDLASNTDIPG